MADCVAGIQYIIDVPQVTSMFQAVAMVVPFKDFSFRKVGIS